LEGIRTDLVRALSRFENATSSAEMNADPAS
jgi:hypothetical protein